MSERQGTADWHAARLGKITASRFADVMSNGRGGGLSKTAESYLLELVSETYTRVPASQVDTLALRHGREYEAAARLEYEESTSQIVVETGFIQHPRHELVGGSPDGLVGSDGIIEIKCPLTPQRHAAVLLSGEMPDEHKYQVQGLLWITGRRWCDFCSYHPDWPSNLRLVVVRVERDEALIENIQSRVLEFEGLLRLRVEQISERWLQMLGARS